MNRTAGAAVGTGIDAFLSEPAKIQVAVAGLVALTAGYYAAKGSLGIVFRFVEARLGKIVTYILQTDQLYNACHLLLLSICRFF